jgi:pectate lyase
MSQNTNTASRVNPGNAGITSIIRAAIALLVAGCLAAAAAEQAELPPREWSEKADGFASVNAMGQNGTTGGTGGYVVTVTNQAELARFAMVPDPCIIRVKGTIHITPIPDPFTRLEKLTPKEIHVTSHKTIIGVGKTAEIVNGGFFLGPGTHNVIIRNLTIRETYVEGDWAGLKTDDDGLQMDGAHHVWVDHCHFTRHGDGLIDGRMGTTYVTVSWCILSKHNKTFGIGWDTCARTAYTLHHIWWRDVACRTGGGGQVLRSHLYSNYYQNVGHGPCADTGTNLILENNLFENVTNPHVLDQAEAEKYGPCSLVATGNIYRNVRGRQDTGGKPFFNPRDFYEYTLDKTEDLPAILAKYAGPQEDIGKDLPEKRDGWFKAIEIPFPDENIPERLREIPNLMP